MWSMARREPLTQPSPFEAFNPGVGQAQATIKVIGHDTHGIVDRILERVEHWTLEGASNAEHPPFTSTDYGTKPPDGSRFRPRHGVACYKHLN